MSLECTTTTDGESTPKTTTGDTSLPSSTSLPTPSTNKEHSKPFVNAPKRTKRKRLKQKPNVGRLSFIHRKGNRRYYPRFNYHDASARRISNQNSPILPRVKQLLKSPKPVGRSSAPCLQKITIHQQTRLPGSRGAAPVDETHQCRNRHTEITSESAQKDSKCRTITHAGSSDRTGVLHPTYTSSDIMESENSKRDRLSEGNEGLSFKIESVYSLAGKTNDFVGDNDLSPSVFQGDVTEQPLDFTRSSKHLDNMNRKLPYGKQLSDTDIDFKSLQQFDNFLYGGSCFTSESKHWSEPEPLDFSKSGTFGSLITDQFDEQITHMLPSGDNVTRQANPKKSSLHNMETHVTTWHKNQVDNEDFQECNVHQYKPSDKHVSSTAYIPISNVKLCNEETLTPHVTMSSRVIESGVELRHNNGEPNGCARFNDESLSDTSSENKYQRFVIPTLATPVKETTIASQCSPFSIGQSFQAWYSHGETETGERSSINESSKLARKVNGDLQNDSEVNSANKVPFNSSNESPTNKSDLLFETKICRPWVNLDDENEDVPKTFSIICGDYCTSDGDDDVAKVLTPVLESKEETSPMFDREVGRESNDTYQFKRESAGTQLVTEPSEFFKNEAVGKTNYESSIDGDSITKENKISQSNQIKTDNPKPKWAFAFRKPSTGSDDSGVDIESDIPCPSAETNDEHGDNLVIGVPGTVYKQDNSIDLPLSDIWRVEDTEVNDAVNHKHGALENNDESIQKGFVITNAYDTSDNGNDMSKGDIRHQVESHNSTSFGNQPDQNVKNHQLSMRVANANTVEMHLQPCKPSLKTTNYIDDKNIKKYSTGACIAQRRRSKSPLSLRGDLRNKYSRPVHVPLRPMSPLKRRWIRQHMAQDRRSNFETPRRRSSNDSITSIDGADSPGHVLEFNACVPDPLKDSLENSIGETRLGIISALNELNKAENEKETVGESYEDKPVSSDQQRCYSEISNVKRENYLPCTQSELKTESTLPNTVYNIEPPLYMNPTTINDILAPNSLNVDGSLTSCAREEENNSSGKFRKDKHVNIRGYYRSISDYKRMKYPAVRPHNECSHSDNSELLLQTVSCGSTYRQNNRFRICARDMAEWRATSIDQRKTRKRSEPCWDKKLTSMPRRSTRLDNDPYVHYLNRLDKERVSDSERGALTYAKQNIAGRNTVAAEQFARSTMEERVATVGSSRIESPCNGGHLITAKEPPKSLCSETSVDNIHSASVVNSVHDQQPIYLDKGLIGTESLTNDLVYECTEGKTVHNGVSIAVDIAEQGSSLRTDSVGEPNGDTTSSVVGIKENCSDVSQVKSACDLRTGNETDQSGDVPLQNQIDNIETVCTADTNDNVATCVTVETTEVDLVTPLDCGAFETVEEDCADIPVSETNIDNDTCPEGASIGLIETTVAEQEQLEVDNSVPDICNLENDFVALDIELPHTPAAGEVICETVVEETECDFDQQATDRSRSPILVCNETEDKDNEILKENHDLDDSEEPFQEIVSVNENNVENSRESESTHCIDEKADNESVSEIDYCAASTEKCEIIRTENECPEEETSSVVDETSSEVIVNQSHVAAVEQITEACVTNCKPTCVDNDRTQIDQFPTYTEDLNQDSATEITENGDSISDFETYESLNEQVEESCFPDIHTPDACGAKSDINLALFGVKASSVCLKDVGRYLKGRASVNIRRKPWRNMGKSKLGMIITEGGSSESESESETESPMCTSKTFETSKEAAPEAMVRPVRKRRKPKGCGNPSCVSCDSYDETRVRALINAIKRFEQAFFGEKCGGGNEEISKDILDSLLISGKGDSKRSKSYETTETMEVGHKVKVRKGKKRKRSVSRGSTSVKKLNNGTERSEKSSKTEHIVESDSLDAWHKAMKPAAKLELKTHEVCKKSKSESTLKRPKQSAKLEPKTHEFCNKSKDKSSSKHTKKSAKSEQKTHEFCKKAKSKTSSKHSDKSRKEDMKYKSIKTYSRQQTRMLPYPEFENKMRKNEEGHKLKAHKSKKKHSHKKERAKTHVKEGRVEKKRPPKISTEFDLFDFKTDSTGGDSTPSSESGRNIFESLSSIKSSSPPSSQSGSDKKQPGPDKKQHRPDKKQPGPDKKQPGLDKKQPGPDKKQPGLDKKQPGPDKKQPGLDKKQPGPDKKQHRPDKKQPGPDKKQPGLDKKQPGSDKKQPGSEKKQPEPDKKQPMEVDKTPNRDGQQKKKSDVAKSSRIQSPQEERVFKLKELLKAQQRAVENIRFKPTDPLPAV